MDHSPPPHDGPHGPHPEPPAGHGMAVVGGKHVFLSHLPMFMRPHDFQVILHASFGAADAAYRADRKENAATRLYTFAPERFVLLDLFPGENGEAPKRTSFGGTLVRNHFEQPPAHPETPVEVASDVEVEVLDVVHQHRFDPEAPPLEHLTYLLFGKGAERFLAHLVTRPPDFDQLLSVDVTGRRFTDKQLLGGIEVRFDGRPNQPGERLREGEQAGAVATVNGRQVPVEAGLGSSSTSRRTTSRRRCSPRAAWGQVPAGSTTVMRADSGRPVPIEPTAAVTASVVPSMVRTSTVSFDPSVSCLSADVKSMPSASASRVATCTASAEGPSYLTRWRVTPQASHAVDERARCAPTRPPGEAGPRGWA
jgi:hypothetical protein